MFTMIKELRKIDKSRRTENDEELLKIYDGVNDLYDLRIKVLDTTFHDPKRFEDIVSIGIELDQILNDINYYQWQELKIIKLSLFKKMMV